MRAVTLLFTLLLAFPVTAAGAIHQTSALHKFPLKHITGQQAYEKVKTAKLPGVDYITFDPTDNSLVARADKVGLEAIKALLAKIDVPQE